MNETINKTDCARYQFETLLTVNDLERMLRIDKRTIERLCKRGALPRPLKIGGSNRWRPTAIAQAIELLESNDQCNGDRGETRMEV